MWNDYARIVTYQESWKDAVEEQGAVATTTNDTGTTTSVTSYDAKTGQKTTTTTINSTVKTYDEDTIEYYSDLYTSGGAEYFLNQFGYTTVTTAENYDATAESWYKEIFEQMDECGYEVVADDKLNDPDWLYQQLSAGNIYLSEQVTENGEKVWDEVSWTSGDNEITTVDDTRGMAKAEAEYEAAAADISAKDERFDLQLKNIDTEHSAVQTEIETLGKVINKNIERSFKMFDA